MNALENIKNSLIDRILATKNERLVQAKYDEFDKTKTNEAAINLQN